MSNSLKIYPTALENFSRDQLVEFNDLLNRTNKATPHPDDVRALRQVLAQTPALWQELGNLAAHALKRVAEFGMPQVLGHESILLTTAELRRSLTLPSDTALEGLLIQECLTASLLHSAMQMRYISAQENSLDPNQAIAWETRLSSSQRRLMRVAESLARLRNLSHPLMQINIAQHQTNIATTAPVTTADGTLFE